MKIRIKQEYVGSWSPSGYVHRAYQVAEHEFSLHISGATREECATKAKYELAHQEVEVIE